MKSGNGAGLLRIYTDERAFVGDRPVFELLVDRARAAGLAGATVLRGRLGYGRSALVHKHHLFDLEDDLPLVIEIIDAEAALRDFAGSISNVDRIGLITLEKVEVLRAPVTAAASDGGSNE
ncbi:hypothetical protein CFHF_19035 [Caulobacter flavus]|uniref:Uncharacterized protein n=1 Tax=Caulobacter flavus TaxID=1679497 RepID=A0A2N5CQ05_9CAUL|nr:MULTISPECIES: DUF190 domain-containing protein [Caulobacter]PLR09233.1 hypothetical protein CFHF_19035 [Caulobacter flavus]